jgi:hypothetical protein
MDPNPTFQITPDSTLKQGAKQNFFNCTNPDQDLRHWLTERKILRPDGTVCCKALQENQKQTAIRQFLRIGSRVADPDPNWIRIQSGQWIRIQEGKNEPQ